MMCCSILAIPGSAVVVCKSIPPVTGESSLFN